ncbi:hypothetical protein FOL47_001959 [Perkinsus chesapeaki]|uniref:Immunoglobulin super DCC subclass member n=1 Tax=Perkinsus chesapeaki TaxID=330153 RepID=A0A7J6N0I0_PERCH|nr:hypothetical protein FOL47_001959 [Perkinsus chesapeaki]
MTLSFFSFTLALASASGRLLQDATTTTLVTTSSISTTDAEVSTVTSAVSTAASVTTTPDPAALQNTCNAYCQQLNGEKSYCKTTIAAPSCFIGDQPCGTFELCGDTVTPTTVVDAPAGDGSFEPACDVMCQSLNDEASYCKWWMPIPTCLGGDQACGDHSVCTSQTWPPAPKPSRPAGSHPYESAPCNAYCVSLNGEGSYCKWWKDEPVCQAGNQSCGVGDCPSGTSAPPEVPEDAHSGHSPACDSYCVEKNPTVNGDRESYCKWWLTVPTCLYGDQHCGPSVCEATSPAP